MPKGVHCNPVRVEARVRNNVLWHAIFDNYESVSEFCRKYKLSQTEVGRLLNLKSSPFDNSVDAEPGSYRQLCLQLSVIFRLLPEDLFPKELYEVKLVRAVAEVPLTVLPSLSSGFNKCSGILSLPEPKSPFEEVVQSELRVKISESLSQLGTREADVLKRRYLNDETLEEVSKIYQVGSERIRQIEAKALRKLRHPSRIKKLISFAE